MIKVPFNLWRSYKDEGYVTESEECAGWIRLRMEHVWNET